LRATEEETKAIECSSIYTRAIVYNL